MSSNDFLNATSNEDKQLEQKKKEKEEIEKYWYKTNSDLRICTIFGNTTSLIMIIKSLIKPTTDLPNERLVNAGYLVYSILVQVIIYLSFKPKFGIEFAHYACHLCLLRFAFRIMDLEGTK